MHSNDLIVWANRLMAPSNGILLWISLSLLLFALAFWAQRRSAAARARADRARREAEREDLGGNSYFMPLPVIEQAVEGIKAYSAGDLEVRALQDYFA